MRLEMNRAVVFGLAGLVLILVAQFGVVPLVKYRKDVNERLQRAAGQLETAVNQRAELAALMQAGGKQMITGKGTLFARLDQLARQLNLSPKVEFIRPTVKEFDAENEIEEVHIRFKGLTQQEMVRYLYESEVRTPAVNVVQIGLKLDKKRFMDADLILAMLRPKK